jgi:sec-independent protein translocase protein TatC
MSLVDHLDELRKRAILCLVATFAGMVLIYCVYNPWVLYILRGPLDGVAGKADNPFAFNTRLVAFLQASLSEAQRANMDLHFIGLLEGFLVKLRTSFIAGMVLTSPFIFYQIWKFVSVGMTAREQKAVQVFFPVSLLLFVCGILIAYFIMMPVVIYFLIAGGGAGLTPNLTVSQYVSPVALCCLGFGVVFQLPLVILVLTRLGIVTPTFLRKKQKYAILMMFVLGAMLTPPDIVSQMLLAFPLIVLYEISIWLSKIAWARRQRSLDD